MTSNFWRLTPQNKAFSNQNKGHLSSRYLYKKGLMFRDFQFRGYFGIEVHQNYPLDMLKNMGIGSFIHIPQMFHQESNGTLRTPR